jgi:hypothetical protein
MTNDKHRKYANFAARCLTLGVAANDPDTSDIHREMALEWLILADAILHPKNIDADLPLGIHKSAARTERLGQSRSTERRIDMSEVGG